MNLLYFASIDIGSNAIRLLISMVIESKKGPIYRKLSLTRVPIRLGDDVFLSGKIPQNKIDDLVDAMIAFRKLMNVYKILDYKAFATSAMRSAENGAEVIAEIAQKSDINIEIISGELEAEMIAPEILPEHLPSLESAVYVDVGGGSTEMTLVKNENVVDSISIQIGTVRFLNNTIDQNQWDLFNEWFKKNNLINSGIPIIGTGGNINKLLKILRVKNIEYFISIEALKTFRDEIQQLTYSERIINLVLNPDRADVLLPACDIFLKVADKLNNSRIYIPKIGLSDGIIKHLYADFKKKQRVN